MNKRERRRTLIYLAGAYRGTAQIDIDRNVAIAKEYARKLIEMGYSVIIPHTMYAGLADDETILKICLTVLEKCDLVVLLPGWVLSEGTRAEVAHASASRVKVVSAIEMICQKKGGKKWI